MEKDAVILLVDHDLDFLTLCRDSLEQKYNVNTAPDGPTGLAALRELGQVAVVISDYDLPLMNGIDFLREVKNISPQTVRIMLAASATPEILISAINQCQIFRFFTKPCSYSDLKEGIDEALSTRVHSAGSRDLQVVRPLLTALAERDPFNNQTHTDLITELCYIMGLQMGLSSQQLANLECLAQIQDIGNLVIPENIIFKEGPLTSQEWDVIRQHPVKGYHIALSSSNTVDIAGLILKHHERWDGKGYPYGLKGKAIPLECRILQVVNAFVVMTNDRPYRKALSREEALKELKQCAGTQFDPEIVDLFFTVFVADQES